jgi:hypothetical protein
MGNFNAANLVVSLSLAPSGKHVLYQSITGRDPTATSAVHCGDGSIASRIFSPPDRLIQINASGATTW